jgi:hypothetical protein
VYPIVYTLDAFIYYYYHFGNNNKDYRLVSLFRPEKKKDGNKTKCWIEKQQRPLHLEA